MPTARSTPTERSRRRSSRPPSPPTARSAGPAAGGAATSSAILGDLLAVARGVGSTWAGLAPATDPASAAVDPLDGPRRWYTFVSDTLDEELPGLLRGAATVGFEDG